MLNYTKAAVKLFLQRFTRRKPGPIRVVFLCQYIPAWNKIKSLYEALASDARFEPILFCVPSDMNNTAENDTLAYYLEHEYTAVDALRDGEYRDLRELSPDYVFYLRPYNHVMPPIYASDTVCRFAKVCVIMYGMTMSKEITSLTLNPLFFRHVYCFFAENEYMKQVNRRLFPFTHAIGLRRSVYYGYPAIAEIPLVKDQPTDSWDFSEAPFRVMWTPRWTTDLALGGTNFFTYKDWILDYAKAHPDTAWLLRPHPLAFETFVKAGNMTQDEVDAYQKAIADLPNTMLDEKKEYIASMWHSSALISDISGILPEYFIMDKPLIYCRSNMILEPTDFTARLLDGCYCVDTPEQMQAVLDDLRAGHDPLREVRRQIIEELFGNTLETTIQKITEELAK